MIAYFSLLLEEKKKKNLGNCGTWVSMFICTILWKLKAKDSNMIFVIDHVSHLSKTCVYLWMTTIIFSVLLTKSHLLKFCSTLLINFFIIISMPLSHTAVIKFLNE